MILLIMAQILIYYLQYRQKRESAEPKSFVPKILNTIETVAVDLTNRGDIGECSICLASLDAKSEYTTN
jgi:hypothetical protein